ncbi:hypothetical protein [Candidatus Avelusimicrobium sp.]|uniref:hypothetical protein n=1 Tax=Candidatus Avelusimicrobium sp. TaxID=3048833 RepID=UPI003D7E7F1C
MTGKLPVWTPSLKGHAVLLGLLLVFCAGLYFTFSFVTTRLPEPFKTQRPAPEATPWINR